MDYLEKELKEEKKKERTKRAKERNMIIKDKNNKILSYIEKNIRNDGRSLKNRELEGFTQDLKYLGVKEEVLNNALDNEILMNTSNYLTVKNLVLRQLTRKGEPRRLGKSSEEITKTNALERLPRKIERWGLKSLIFKIQNWELHSKKEEEIVNLMTKVISSEWLALEKRAQLLPRRPLKPEPLLGIIFWYNLEAYKFKELVAEDTRLIHLVLKIVSNYRAYRSRYYKLKSLLDNGNELVMIGNGNQTDKTNISENIDKEKVKDNLLKEEKKKEINRNLINKVELEEISSISQKSYGNEDMVKDKLVKRLIDRWIVRDAQGEEKRERNKEILDLIQRENIRIERLGKEGRSSYWRPKVEYWKEVLEERTKRKTLEAMEIALKYKEEKKNWKGRKARRNKSKLIWKALNLKNFKSRKKMKAIKNWFKTHTQKPKLERVKRAFIKEKLKRGHGLALKIGGRVSGVNMARSRIKKVKGVMPQSFRTPIHYKTKRIQTKWGTWGMKVWMN